MASIYSCDLHTCEGCIWFDQCAEEKACEHFSPADDSLDLIAYESDLQMRVEEYDTAVEEYSDGD